MAIQVSGATATAAQLGNIRAGLFGRGVQSGMGTPFSQYKYSGPVIDFTLGAVGDPQNNAFSGCPADAVAIEVWASANASDDYLFFATLSGHLSSAGVLATNVAANLLNRRFVGGGAHMVIPLQAMGAVPAGFRFAGSKNGALVHGRYISSASNLRYKLSAASVATNLTGADATQQLPYLTASQFPDLAAQAAVDMMISGTSGLAARITIDGTAPTAVKGDIWPVGSRIFIDAADHGIAWSALKIWLPTGVNIHASTYTYA